jgi:hypothetical protein
LNGKTITDPLYGNIHLSEIEARIVSTRCFQRLHNIRQLGLGHLVFPSAGYSRFAHSVGACYNADRILVAISANSAKQFSDEERQAFRIAALIHDLGHFPFSHTTEHASKRFYSEEIFKTEEAAQEEMGFIGPEEPPASYLDHEDTGKQIFLEDPEIERAFNEVSSVSKEMVTSAFIDENLSTIISSDLDCDRLDYLRRTSLHSGAPYGAVDVDFIISKSTIDKKGRFCFDRKAKRATDHLLVSRFYDFMQIPYQKTVAALEWSLEESVVWLLKEKCIDLSENGIRSMIASDRWASFDDGQLITLLREARHDCTESVALDHIAAVLDRSPAKLVYSWEALAIVKNNEQASQEQLLEYKIKEIANRFGVDPRRFKIWKAPFKLSKAGPILQGSPSDRDYSDEEAQQLIHILQKDNSVSVPLVDLESTVSHHLASLRYRTLRVYYLPSTEDSQDIKSRMRAAFEA